MVLDRKKKRDSAADQARNDAEEQGRRAYGTSRGCPYPPNSLLSNAWAFGWNEMHNNPKYRGIRRNTNGKFE